MFADPDNNLIQAKISPDDIVADIGAGSGAYSVAAGRIIRGGRVYAIEVQKNLLSRIQAAAIEAGVSNIEVLWGDVEMPNGTKLRDESITFAILSNIFFQVEDRESFFREINRVLRSGARVLLVDWSESCGGMGPDPLRVIKKETARHAFESHGFIHDEDIHAGAHHYGMIFHKSS